MSKKYLIWLLAPLVVCLSSLAFGEQEKADLVLVNGKVHTVDEARPAVESVAVKDGLITALGSNSETRKLIGPKTLVVDAQGKLVLPGFIDAHTHFVSGGHSLITLTFRGVNSIAKVQEMVAAKIRELPPGAPVFGSQYDHTLFPGGNWPTRQDLDTVSPHNPVVIDRVDGHSVWVNSLALERSGITKDTKNPFGGEILRDPRTGEPTGILTEAAVSLVRVKIRPEKSSPEDDIKRALAYAAKLGVTGIHTSSNLNEMEIYKKLDQEGKLTLRVYAWLPIEGMDSYINKGIRQGQGDDMVKVGFLKAFIDGTLGSGTALMFAPFADEPDKKGLPQYPEEKFYELVDKAYLNGFQIGVHAIGDKAVNWVLNAVERAEKKHGMKDLRNRIEHGQVIVPSDVPRFKGLGVIASMQPTHCTTDMRFCERRIGLERSKNAYIWKSLQDAGAVLAFGTDWDVEPLDPMRGLYSAVTRKNIEFDFPEGGWFPEQRISMAEAIKHYTLDAAYASFEETRKGSLGVGKLADLVVLSKDLFTIAPKEILTTEVLCTILGGKVVYKKI